MNIDDLIELTETHPRTALVTAYHRGKSSASPAGYKADVKSKLIKLAAEMVRGQGMPSDVIEDWTFPKTTPVGAKRKIVKQSEKAREQTRLWAIAISDIADAL